MSSFTRGDLLEARVTSALEQLQAWILDKAPGLVEDDGDDRPVILRLHLFSDISLDVLDKMCHVCRGTDELAVADAIVLTPNPTFAIFAEATVCKSCRQYLQEKGTEV